MLPPDEWSRLEGTEAGAIWATMQPDTTQVVVVEDDDGQIVGCWVAMCIAHVECLWVAPSHRRKASVGRRLWRGMQTALAEWGVTSAWTAAASDDVRRMLASLDAVSISGDHYLVRVQR